MAANTTPQVNVAGHTSSIAGSPLVTRIRYAGNSNENGALSQPATPLTFARGNPVIAASVITGMPMDPKGNLSIRPALMAWAWFAAFAFGGGCCRLIHSGGRLGSVF